MSDESKLERRHRIALDHAVLWWKSEENNGNRLATRQQVMFTLVSAIVGGIVLKVKDGPWDLTRPSTWWCGLGLLIFLRAAAGLLNVSVQSSDSRFREWFLVLSFAVVAATVWFSGKWRSLDSSPWLSAVVAGMSASVLLSRMPVWKKPEPAAVPLDGDSSTSAVDGAGLASASLAWEPTLLPGESGWDVLKVTQVYDVAFGATYQAAASLHGKNQTTSSHLKAAQTLILCGVLATVVAGLSYVVEGPGATALGVTGAGDPVSAEPDILPIPTSDAESTQLPGSYTPQGPGGATGGGEADPRETSRAHDADRPGG